ncbi:MAG: hypothetical protein AABX93_02715 [Nanoarchaeota archaeon]
MINGFTATNWKKRIALIPTEDSYDFDHKNLIFSVADGVTRDPYETLPNTHTLLGGILFSLNYPRPSPAKIAADIFNKTFQEVMRDYLPKNRNEEAIKKAFGQANWRIKKWNYDNLPYFDYAPIDLAGCVASGAVENPDMISIGFTTDCGVAIFDEKGNLVFRTPNESPDGKFFSKLMKSKNLTWNDVRARRIIRRDYRNNDVEHSYGVLTGEEKAMEYVKTFSHELKPNEHLMVYSDGLEDTIFSGKFADKLRQNDFKGIEKLCRQEVKTEGTLVHYLKEI